MPRQFSNLPYGPLALRPLLRRTLLPGERLIGWASVQGSSPACLTLFRTALAILPLIGPVLGSMAGAALGPQRRLLLLTDRRLLMLCADARAVSGAEGAIMHQAPLEAVVVRTAMWGMSFVILIPGMRSFPTSIDPNQSRPAERLCRALALMDPRLAEVAGAREHRLAPGVVHAEAQRVPYSPRPVPRSSARRPG